MNSFLKILVGAICLCSCVRAQIKYDRHPVAQKVQYDDGGETYQPYTHDKKDSIKKSLPGDYGKSYGESAPVYEGPIDSPYPQKQIYSNPLEKPVSYYPSKTDYLPEEPRKYDYEEPTYHSAENSYDKKKPIEEYKRTKYENLKSKSTPSDEHEELQYSQDPEKPSYYQSNQHREAPLPPLSYQPSHYASEAPKSSYPVATQSYQPLQEPSPYQPNSPEAYQVLYQPAAQQPAHYQPAQQPAHYQPAQQPSHYQPAHQPSHYQPAHQPGHYQPAQQPGQYQPEGSYPQSAPSYQPGKPTSLVKRDPKLPLYFTMYEKRIIQDPTDQYGKGPWRYLTYGHGITYGSKEPGKVFEKGYGYIRALGRDHCKLPENQCPPKDDKPFEYDGRKEPYFGYRPH
ncbi:hypothetical protein JTE90_022148 [Oedothorax gibbosus]|uniref:Uncharacterized protein n=1 Tax=Oedothorax gibbosus TaxID=931172 RepID=A0AAV6VSS0_9ARAC|nr:hypothetical protein JTE90_022148 [Oedothorax gibbosus]